MVEPVSFIPYGTQWIENDDVQAVVEALRSDFLTQGPRIADFERAIAEYVGAKYCVAFCNGTAALHCAVKALAIPAGYEGVTSSNTFVASANCLAYNRLVPVFADIDSRTFNVTPETLHARITRKTRVLLPVHYAGQPCDMKGIAKLSEEKSLSVIEDAAHAIGSRYLDGSHVGNCRFSRMTIFSFHPVKTITTGEGGAVTTNDAELYRKLTMLRSHGITKDPEQLSQVPGSWYYEQQELGFNYRITDLQCALGACQLRKLAKFKQRRREIVTAYNKAFSRMEHLAVPHEQEGVDSCFHLYTVQIDFKALGTDRAKVMQALLDKRIGSQVLYIPVHTQPWYKKTYGYEWGDYPIAEEYYEKTLSLPLFPKMTDIDVERVIESVKEVLRT